MKHLKIQPIFTLFDMEGKTRFDHTLCSPRPPYVPLALLSTGNAVSQLRWKMEGKKRHKENKGNGGHSVGSDWISSKKWREKLRHEKGVLIGVINVCRLLTSL